MNDNFLILLRNNIIYLLNFQICVSMNIKSRRPSRRWLNFCEYEITVNVQRNIFYFVNTVHPPICHIFISRKSVDKSGFGDKSEDAL